MILDSIAIKNFGAYFGRQEACLTPTKTKPVILFGGMNGGGKTTLLDAIQLGFYGAKAKVSNRGRLGYKDYLRQSINRGADPAEGAAITIKFHRLIDGEVQHFEIERQWCETAKGIEESIRVHRNGLPDEVATDHWDEVIDAYLPSGISHLFFFDGEQIKDLAEGSHAADILGTAIHSLLGLDLVDKLQGDLKMFERRKRSEGLDPEAAAKLAVALEQVKQIDSEQEKLAYEEAGLNSQRDRLKKEVADKLRVFEREGGELYERRTLIDEELVLLKQRRTSIKSELREWAAGPMPLLLVNDLLRSTADRLGFERKVKQAKALAAALEERDQAVLANLGKDGIPAKVTMQIEKTLKNDRQKRAMLAEEPIILNADDALSAHIAHLRTHVLPAAKEKARVLVEHLAKLEEQIARLEAQITRIPSGERIQVIQNELDAARTALEQKELEIKEIEVRKAFLLRQRAEAEARLDRFEDRELDARLAADDRQRMLKHADKVRNTLETFRAAVVKKHTSNIEALMLESFQRLLRKSGLATQITIDPTSFDPSLLGREGKELPFDRLSAGERQLLATSMLWGLARASGRPVPTVIDTPLGRLDSSHRRHLIERYFPYASHQVILLSTDEEIVDSYFDSLKPYLARTYKLEHNEKRGTTSIVEGYFDV